MPTLLPDWLTRYQPAWLAGDMTAGLIVTVMLIPQSLAYAMLAGLPPEVGLYASILPLFAYAVNIAGFHCIGSVSNLAEKQTLRRRGMSQTIWSLQ